MDFTALLLVTALLVGAILFLLRCLGLFRSVTFERDQTLQPCFLAFRRHVGPYSEVGSLFGELNGVAERLQADGQTLSGTTAGVYLDNPNVVASDKCRSCCGLAMGRDH